MRHFVFGLLVGLAVPVLVACLTLLLGGIPVATDSRPLPFEETLASTVVNRVLRPERAKEAPIPDSSENLLAGVKVYNNNCAGCHGRPGGETSSVAKGMFPPPPQLFSEGEKSDEPSAAIFWIVKNGIRLTGMPGFKNNLSEREMWQVSLLVRTSTQLSPVLIDALNAK